MQGRGRRELPASTNAAAGLKEPEARLYECIKWMLIGGPRFLPLVELLLLSSLPFFLPPSLTLFFRTNATFLPSVIYFADSLSGPWRTTPLQPVHSRRRPVYTALIGSAPHCPCDLPLSPTPLFLSLFLFYASILP